jgi:hypothetical protein
MAILVTTICEHANKHGRSRRPTAAMWPHSQRQDTLQSDNILRNKFKSLNLENIIVIYTIMTIRGRAYALPGGQESYHHILQTWWFPVSQNGGPLHEGVFRLP